MRDEGPLSSRPVERVYAVERRLRATSPHPYGTHTHHRTRLYSSSLAILMSCEAPLPKASSMAASLLTREARMGVSEVPSRQSSPCVKAAAEVCSGMGVRGRGVENTGGGMGKRRGGRDGREQGGRVKCDPRTHEKNSGRGHGGMGRGGATGDGGQWRVRGPEWRARGPRTYTTSPPSTCTTNPPGPLHLYDHPPAPFTAPLHLHLYDQSPGPRPPPPVPHLHAALVGGVDLEVVSVG